MALVALTLNTLSKARRVEGYTTNVVAPIEMNEMGELTSATLAAGASFVIPTSLNEVSHVSITGINAGGSVVVWAAPTVAAVAFAAIGADALAGATTITLPSGASAVADVYNGCTVEIHTGGEVQTAKILDYAITTKIATLDAPLDLAATTATTNIVVRGIVVTSIAGATTPSYSVSVTGRTN